MKSMNSLQRVLWYVLSLLVSATILIALLFAFESQTVVTYDRDKSLNISGITHFTLSGQQIERVVLTSPLSFELHKDRRSKGSTRLTELQHILDQSYYIVLSEDVEDLQGEYITTGQVELRVSAKSDFTFTEIKDGAKALHKGMLIPAAIIIWIAWAILTYRYIVGWVFRFVDKNGKLLGYRNSNHSDRVLADNGRYLFEGEHVQLIPAKYFGRVVEIDFAKRLIRISPETQNEYALEVSLRSIA